MAGKNIQDPIPMTEINFSPAALKFKPRNSIGFRWTNTPTGMVQRGMKILKDSLRAKLEEGQNLNEALSRSLNIIRKTVHSINESLFARHYG